MRWRNEQLFHLRQSRPLTEEEQQLYFDNVVSKLFANPEPDQILFSYLENNECIGYGGLVHINWADRNAEVSFIVDTQLETERYSEYFNIFMTMLKAVAFEDLGLHKIYTYAFDLRPHLYSVLESNGFIREATLREHHLYEGKYVNVVIHSIWNDLYDAVNYVDCTREQLLEILTLRNREDVRMWMSNTDVIPVEKHFSFVESLKEDPDRLYFAIYKNGVLIGLYNLHNRGNGVWESGAIADVAFRGTGDTEKWERQMIRSLPKYGIKTVVVKIKHENLRSIGYIKKLGFQEHGRDNVYVYFILPIQ
jgi:RimJ/RimL family protein N-acetyltransferase